MGDATVQWTASSLPMPAVTVSTNSPLPAERRPVSIRQDDLIQSIADALQYISYYHPVE